MMSLILVIRIPISRNNSPYPKGPQVIEVSRSSFSEVKPEPLAQRNRRIFTILTNSDAYSLEF